MKYPALILLIALTGCASRPRPNAVNVQSLMPPARQASARIVVRPPKPYTYPRTNSMTWQWTESCDASVTGYRLFAGTNSGIYTTNWDCGMNTQWNVKLLYESTNVTWWVVVSAYDKNGQLSPYSKENHWPPVVRATWVVLSRECSDLADQIMACDELGKPWKVVGEFPPSCAGGAEIIANQSQQYYRLASGKKLFIRRAEMEK